MELSFDGEQIIVTPLCSIDQYVEKRRELGHKIYVLYYFDKESLCTTIYADETDQSLRIENHTEHLVKTAFGRNEHPTWQDYEFFLEERCIPRGRAGLREYMEAIGVLEYDPMEIILKTEGRMAEDGQWLRVEVLK